LQANHYSAGQGQIALDGPSIDDPAVRKLIEKFRTIPQLSFPEDVMETHSLNGANFFIARKILRQVGGFDERLGPGASGTSEDVELALRLSAAGVRIGYARDSVVFHRVDRERLTESYFAESHRCQGRSRLLIKNRGYTEILLNLARAYVQYGLYSVIGDERHRYRSKGRIYHYLSMLEAKRNRSSANRS
jgi:GT2 family glycosyltransferase